MIRPLLKALSEPVVWGAFLFIAIGVVVLPDTSFVWFMAGALTHSTVMTAMAAYRLHSEGSRS